MTHEQTIAAVRNLHTQVVFVLVDDTIPNKTTIINPEGKVLTVPNGLFETPYPVKESDFDQHFTGPQKDAIVKYFKKGSTKSGSQSLLVPKKRPTQSGRKPTNSRNTTFVSAAPASEWTAPKLTFYKHKIDPLSDHQSFRIVLESGQSYKMKKSDFMREFNDVVVSTEYWREGSFTYKEMPDKAKRFAEKS